MYICLWNIRQIIIEHVRQFVNVNAARSDIRGHQYADIAIFKCRQRTLTCALAFVPMDRLCFDSSFYKLARDPVRTML